MKMRNDCVSNSGSCSFFIKLRSEEDKAKILPLLKKYCVEGDIKTSEKEPVYNFTIFDFKNISIKKLDTDIKSTDLILIDLGSDDFAIEEFNGMLWDIECNCPKIEMYSHPYATHTFGRLMPKGSHK